MTAHSVLSMHNNCMGVNFLFKQQSFSDVSYTFIPLYILYVWNSLFYFYPFHSNILAFFQKLVNLRSLVSMKRTENSS